MILIETNTVIFTRTWHNTDIHNKKWYTAYYNNKHILDPCLRDTWEEALEKYQNILASIYDVQHTRYYELCC